MRKTLTFIGNGNMAFSLVKGLKESYDIEIVGRDMQKLQKFEELLNIRCKKHLIESFDITDCTIVLCVKPANIQEVASQLKGKAKTLYSVLAGTSIKKLSSIQAQNYIRTMPNLAASVSKSMTTVTGTLTCKQEAIDIFKSIGTVLWVSSEKELDIATALAGSGPAYLALIAEALTDGAVKQGIKRNDAMILMRGLFEGFGSLIQNKHPAVLKDEVMSPGGTTAAGYTALEESGVRNGCIKAIESAYMKTKEL